MSDSKALVRRLRQVATALKVAAKWNGSGLAVDATKDDFLYELDCYFRAALAAKEYFDIQVAGKTVMTKSKKNAVKWPKKPGHKKNFSYLSLLSPKSGKEAFQLCPGVEILDKDGKARAPDVSLQSTGAPDQPTHSHLLSIWDAKFTSKTGARLPDTAVSDFVFTFQQLASPKAPKQWTKLKGKEWQRSGLLTNAQASTEPDSVFVTYGVSETSGFPDGPPKTRP